MDALKPVESNHRLLLKGVTKTFCAGAREVAALDNVDLEVGCGEFVCLLGPSGCGKSTILNLVAGLERADSGQVLSSGKAVDHPGRDRMMMFQDSALFPWLDVLGNVMFGLRLSPQYSKEQRVELAEGFIRMVGLEKFARSNVHELSGGMRQRVALARALAPGPDVLLMDEPFAALDAMTREQLYSDLQGIFQKHSMTIVFVTHNVREAVCLGDRVVLLSPHPGRIQEEFRIELPRPRDINDGRVAEHASLITRSLRRHLPKAETPAIE